MTRKPETIAFWRGRLPHWEVEDGSYFVTIHLAGAIPAKAYERIHQISRDLDRLSTAIAASPQAAGRPDARSAYEARLRVQRQIFKEMERWLDRSEHVSHLHRPEVAAMVMEAIEHRQQTGVWNMFEHVLMPNHVHLFFEVLKNSLKWVLEDFKRWTGHQAAKLIDLSGKRFWQDEWFDHWSRSDEEDERIARYIRRNPETAGLVKSHLDWPYGSWSRSRLPGGTSG
ncbi:MAG: transposase [Planctomycetes bacterium]|nr:transposase [Planctomycetota bacterium]